MARADNLAQDLTDRLIFRTTDTTLWCDGNDNVAGGLTLLADFQDGAVMRFQDMLIMYAGTGIETLSRT